jgi:hypothetical protein
MKKPFLRAALLAVLVSLTLSMGCAGAAEPGARTELARSAQVVIDATPAGKNLVLAIRRAADQSVIDDKDVTVSIDGKSQIVTRQPDGTYALPMDELQGSGGRTIEVIVAHDGIREVLDGKWAAAEPGSRMSLTSSRKQLLWWILNAAVLLIGVIALSRRKSPTAASAEDRDE